MKRGGGAAPLGLAALPLLLTPLCAAQQHQLTSGALTLTVNASSLALAVSVGGERWLAGSAFTREGRASLSPADGSLTPTAPPTKISGTDKLGPYTGLKMTWANASTATEVVWVTSVRAYTGSGRIAFRQEHPAGVTTGRLLTGGAGTEYNSNGVSTAWPALFPAPAAPPLGLVSYAGASAGAMVSYGSFPENVTEQGEMSGCVVIVPKPAGGPGAADPLPHTLVFSQLDHFFASAVTRITLNGQPAAGAGLMNIFNSAPAGFASEAVLVLASASDAPLPSTMDGAPPGGLNHAALKWGETLLQFHGARQRAAVSGSAASDRARYFGYSTTAYYHHNPCDPCGSHRHSSSTLCPSELSERGPRVCTGATATWTCRSATAGRRRCWTCTGTYALAACRTGGC
eukprot:COSAG04_NODE_2364_length_4263_cov_4.814601_6_plen_401_part_00